MKREWKGRGKTHAKQMWEDEEYQRLVPSDALLFSKVSESRVMFGFDKEFIVEGKVL
jgi:hypothetical protein